MLLLSFQSIPHAPHLEKVMFTYSQLASWHVFSIIVTPLLSIIVLACSLGLIFVLLGKAAGALPIIESAIYRTLVPRF